MDKNKEIYSENGRKALGKAPPTKEPGVDYEGRIIQMVHYRTALLEAAEILEAIENSKLDNTINLWVNLDDIHGLAHKLRISAGEVED